jgi:hypothetical protein
MAMMLTRSRGSLSRAQEESVSGLTRTAEQEDWRKTVRAYFEQKSPAAEVRRTRQGLLSHLGNFGSAPAYSRTCVADM